MKPSFLPLLLVALAAPAHAATPANQKSAKPQPVTAAEPADPVTALLERSHDAQVRGEGELAVRLAQSAIVADPARPSSYVALGDLYAATGQGEFARSYYDAALEIDPNDMGAQHAIAALVTAKATASNSP